jgi:predicted ATPase
MIREVIIENFKSVRSLQVELGRINVFIGENGSGKSNILEAIAMASAAADKRVDNEFLFSRGIRVTEPQFMRSAFDSIQASEIKFFTVDDQGSAWLGSLRAKENATFTRWEQDVHTHEEALHYLRQFRASRQRSAVGIAQQEQAPKVIEGRLFIELLSGFLIYSPENSALRVFQSEGQILPLGIKGEGLLAHLKALGSEKYKHLLEKISSKLSLIDWFEAVEVPHSLEPIVLIRDRYVAEGSLFDQRSANEGFLFLLFYFTLFISPDTPAFFAIDNVDASLNPKLCSRLVNELVQLSKEHNKQAILTTHNPALLDGLDLHDDEQRLFVIKRSLEGHTKIKRVMPPQKVSGTQPVSLSEAFMRGYLGGLPENF